MPFKNALAKMESDSYDRRVQEVTPTAEQARAAVAEAGNQAARVRRTDKQFSRILYGVASLYLLVAILMGLFPHGGSPLVALAVMAIVFGGLAGTLVLFWRIRAYSRTGALKFTWAAAAFCWWNAAVVGASGVTGWWGPHQPATHFSVSALVAVIPLIVAAWLIGRR